MTRKSQLEKSSARLQTQGAVWLRETREAGETFWSETRAAGEGFATEMGAASGKLAKSWSRSADGFRKALWKEALDWQKLVLQTRDAYVEAVRQRVVGLEKQARSARSALTPDAVEATVLESTRDLLAKAQASVDERIDKTAKPKRAPAKSRAAKKAITKSSNAPIRNYDELSAKDVVSRVQRLSGPQATAVLDYERSRKKRATVIRAAEKRLASAG